MKEIRQLKKCCLARFLKMFLKFPTGGFYLDSFGAFITILQVLEFKAAWQHQIFFKKNNVTTSTKDFLRKNPSNFAIARDLQNENMKYMYMAYIL